MTVPLDKPLVCPILVGRAAYLEAIERAVGQVADGRGRTVVIAGEAGLGKSRLVAEARAIAAQRACLILEGHCFEPDRALPFAPLLDLLRTRFAGLSVPELQDEVRTVAPELVKLLPELIIPLPGLAATPALEPEQEKRRLFHALAGYLAQRAAGRPVLLVVEDLHWSDETSLELLLDLARRLASLPALLLLTYRTDEVGASLGHLLAELDRGRLATELPLAPLSPPDVDAMLRAIFGLDRPLRADFLDALYALTEGNPFFIEEVLKSLVAAGDILPATGRWDRKPVGELRIPRTVEDAVRRRVERLSQPARETLVMAAVAGQRFEFALLEELTGHDERELLRQIRELISAQLVVEESADRFAFRHALTRRAVYTDLLARERRALHRQIAEALERLSATRPDPPAGSGQAPSAPSGPAVADLAYHFYEANAWPKALEYARLAGERAQAMHAPHAALEHFTRALDVAGALALPPPRDVLRGRGLAHETRGEFDSARADHESALDAARSAGDRRAEWQTLLDLGFLWSWRDYARTGDYFRRALELAREMDEPSILARSLNRVGNWYLNLDQPLEARRYHEEALATFEALDDRRGIAETLDLLGIAAFNIGAMERGVAYYERAMGLFRELGDRRGLVFGLAMLAQRGGYYAFGIGFPTGEGVAACTRQAEQAVEIAREIGWRAGEAFALIHLLGCLGSQGEYARALATGRRSLEIAEEIEHRLWIAAAHTSLGMLYLHLLTAPVAERHLEQGLALAREAGSQMFVRLSTGLLASNALLQGEPARAGALLASVLPPDAPAESRAQQWCCLVRAELALAGGDPSLALGILESLESPRPDRPSAWIGPRSWLLRGKALAALRRPAEAEAAVRMAHDAVRREDARSMLWRTHAELGRLYHALGSAAEATREIEAARAVLEELAANVPDEPMPELSASLSEHFLHSAEALLPRAKPLTPLRAAKLAFGGLTGRERQVAALIARGKLNREIAEALVVGEATVETHVSNILAKLGFTSRAQVAAWAVEKGLVDKAG